MEYSRRHLLRVGQAVFAAALLPKTGICADWGESGSLMTPGRFASLVSASFRVQLDAAGRWFILLSVEDMTPKTPPFQPFMAVPRYSKRSAPPKTEAFALTFQSAGDALPQGTYVFEHETTGRLPLFIVPAGNGTYVAVINRLAVE